jgi:hypothetical protein
VTAITPDNVPTLMLILYVSVGLLVTILWLLIMWAIIRSAVLSALRKHSAEERDPRR